MENEQNKNDEVKHEDVNDPEQQKRNIDPQEDEKNGNYLGELFDKVFGDVNGDKSVGEKDAANPDKQGSIKD